MDERSEKTHQIVRRDRVTVTAAVATYNEEEYIGKCLMDLLAQAPAQGDVEILVVDGSSTDRTLDVVRSFPEYGSSIRILRNPRHLQVCAWNIALREARGEFFAMMTAHAEYAHDYFAKCMETLQRTGAAAVGGVPRAQATGILGNAVAWCMSTPFGVGGARFRYLKREEESDTVPLIFARCKTIREIGGWDEAIPFDEDSDLSYRLRARGGRLIVSPEIGVRYHVRKSLRALWMQMFRYGYWRRFTQLKHPGRVPLRVLAPPMLVAAMLLSAVMCLTPLRALGLAVPALYAAFIAVAAALSAPRIGISALAVPAALATMHAAYGVGWWNAAIKGRSSLRDKCARTFAR